MTASLIRKSSSSIDSRFGKRPEDRTIDELMETGLVVIDKPMGPTSHQVAAWVRDILGIRKTGHGGTLDPRATGVLPIGLGNAVRAMDYIHSAGKRYIGLMKLHDDVDTDALERIFREFTGEIFQTPPVRSAVKRALRKRTIESLGLLERSGNSVLFDVRCEGGTYVRSLCVDIGDALGTGAHLQELRRIEAGPFAEKDAITLHALRDAVEFRNDGDDRELRKAIIPMERIFHGWKRIVAKDSAIDALCHGATLAIPGIVELSKNIDEGDRVAIFSLKDEIVATGTAILDTEDIIDMKEGEVVRLERVFMEPGTYPKSWASRADIKGRTRTNN
ncbi:MAG: RNA-guided pseudouridylation complex pseudouridine synthase subunit Cbf5 [Thermoplasmata archaeon]